MESAFGADFSGVRIHAGSAAAGLSRDIQAHAFTHGSDIYFNHGQYDPHTDGGRRLLAHELTHVVQQRGASSIQRVAQPGTASDPCTEAEKTKKAEGDPQGARNIEQEPYPLRGSEDSNPPLKGPPAEWQRYKPDSEICKMPGNNSPEPSPSKEETDTP